MAESFALNPGGVVAGQAPAGGNVPQAQAQAFSSVATPDLSQAAAGAAIDSATFDAVLKLGGEILAPQIKAAQTEQFLTGVTRAAQGEALKDIVDSQPWFTQIFGPSNAAIGARAYSVQAQIADWSANMERQMPELAKVSAGEVQQASMKAMQSVLTGDTIADAAIMTQYAEHLGPLMKRHAKENYAYQQDQANRAQVKGFNGIMADYQQMSAAEASGRGTVTKEDLTAAQDNLIGQLQKFPGQSDKSYEENVKDALAAAADSGNFAAIKMLEDRGVIASLTPDAQRALGPVFRAGAQRALTAAMPKLYDDMLALQSDMTQDPRLIPERVAAINRKAAQLTGVDEKYGTAIGLGQLDNLGLRVMGAQERMAAAQDAQALKVAKEQASQRAAAMAVQTGNLELAKAWLGAKESDIEGEAAKEWQRRDVPGKIALIRTNNSKTPYDTIREDLNSTFKAEKFTSQVAQTAAVFKGLQDAGDEDRIGKYFTAAQAGQLTAFTRAAAAGVSGEAAWEAARILNPKMESVIPDKAKKGIQEEIRKQVDKANSQYLLFDKLTDASQKALEMAVAAEYKDFNGYGMSTESAAKAAYGRVTSRGVDIMGSHVALGQPGAVPLSTVLATGKDVVPLGGAGDLVDQYMKDQLKTLRMTEGFIIRGPDDKGRATFTVIGEDKDTMLPRNFRFTSDDLKKLYVSKPDNQKPSTGSDERIEQERWMRARQADLNPVR